MPFFGRMGFFLVLPFFGPSWSTLVHFWVGEICVFYTSDVLCIKKKQKFRKSQNKTEIRQKLTIKN